ncbi:MAG: hypothetical protein A3J93_00150 [Candidatus Magasanikbacteria bacterium RIFOXYC2_FULL_42_28]|uniref:Uncharacterized protein n=1 Tax=Candidatus Magasanikbacteria bacterium RIFOXYC2_FULL_42_28 TaxID=1798704 RepID=A0A1F6NW85_9BACT|nr:MAG: hypothetical protein A3J93_00150 [Candidatus Magasanikbacteria bacterium RIFOXYC2_FULL_42_28]
MKWYKKQLDQIKKSAKAKEDKTDEAKPASGRGFDAKKLRATPRNFRDPVGASKRTRKKTDLP